MIHSCPDPPACRLCSGALTHLHAASAAAHSPTCTTIRAAAISALTQLPHQITQALGDENDSYAQVVSVPNSFTASHRLSPTFTAFRCFSPPFTAFHRGTAVASAGSVLPGGRLRRRRIPDARCTKKPAKLHAQPPSCLLYPVSYPLLCPSPLSYLHALLAAAGERGRGGGALLQVGGEDGACFGRSVLWALWCTHRGTEHS